METRTQFIIALTSIITSSFTVFLSNFLAPRINAWYEQKYRNGLVFKKTLRILLEIETYVQRNLRLPTLNYLSQSITPKLKESGYVNDEQAELLCASLPQFFQQLQPQVAEMLPDKSEALDQEFSLILKELSAVDPLLAYKISERHSINPIQKLTTNWLDLFKTFGFEINEDDKDIQLLRGFAESQKAKLIDELLSDLRKDILTVAARTGKKGLKEIELYFKEQDSKRRKDAQTMAEDIAEFLPKKTQHSKEEPKSNSVAESKS